MALSSKDWAFVFDICETIAEKVYERGYKDGKTGKSQASPAEMKLPPATKMRLQTLYNNSAQGKNQ